MDPPNSVFSPAVETFEGDFNNQIIKYIKKNNLDIIKNDIDELITKMLPTLIKIYDAFPLYQRLDKILKWGKYINITIT